MRLGIAALSSLLLIMALRDPIERHVLHTPMAAPVMIGLYGAAVIVPWWVLKWFMERQ